MKILLMRVTLRASWVHSLKEKRMVIKSLIQRLRNKFNISVGEVDEQDVHQTLVIGIAGVCGNISSGGFYYREHNKFYRGEYRRRNS